MKKLIALLLALITVFTMTVPAFADEEATPSDPTIEVIPEEELTEEQKLYIERLLSGEVNIFDMDPYGTYEEPIELATVQLMYSLSFLALSPVAIVSPVLMLIPPIGIAAASMPIVGVSLTVIYTANLILVAPVKEIIWLYDNGYLG